MQLDATRVHVTLTRASTNNNKTKIPQHSHPICGCNCWLNTDAIAARGAATTAETITTTKIMSEQPAANGSTRS